MLTTSHPDLPKAAVRCAPPPGHSREQQRPCSARSPTPMEAAVAPLLAAPDVVLALQVQPAGARLETRAGHRADHGPLCGRRLAGQPAHRRGAAPGERLPGACGLLVCALCRGETAACTPPAARTAAVCQPCLLLRPVPSVPTGACTSAREHLACAELVRGQARPPARAQPHGQLQSRCVPAGLSEPHHCLSGMPWSSICLTFTWPTTTTPGAWEGPSWMRTPAGTHLPATSWHRARKPAGAGRC